jgi:hypothetical protein
MDFRSKQKGREKRGIILVLIKEPCICAESRFLRDVVLKMMENNTAMLQSKIYLQFCHYDYDTRNGDQVKVTFRIYIPNHFRLP